MTQHEITTVAYARLQHFWELHGSAVNPADTIHSIAKETASGSLAHRYLEDALYDYWLALNATINTDPFND